LFNALYVPFEITQILSEALPGAMENKGDNGGDPVKKTELTAWGIRCADHATPSNRKSWH
jgi:hypothetical protein